MNACDLIARVHELCGTPGHRCPTDLHVDARPPSSLTFALWADKMRARGKTPLNAANAVYVAIVALGTPQDKAAILRAEYLAGVLSI